MLAAAVSFAMCGMVRAEEIKDMGDKEPEAAMKAFKLRMEGKIEKAGELLEKTLDENPEDAAAHYELARIEFHMALGDMSERHFVKAKQSIEEAVKNAPDNVMYRFFAGQIYYYDAYKSAMTGGPGTKEKLARTIGAFESALKLKPDYHQAMLYIVELYSEAPEEMGGDKSKAEQYTRKLEKLDEVFGAKGRALLLPEEIEEIDYWKEVLRKHRDNADVLEELGKAYLDDDKVDDAVRCFEEAVKIDSEKAFLFLDLSIYHTFRAMSSGRDSEVFQTSVKSGDAAVARYIDSEPVLPMLAYALGVQYKYKQLSLGEEGPAEKLLERAEGLDPYFSKATGAPPPDLFIPPGEISENHRYLMRPF